LLRGASPGATTLVCSGASSLGNGALSYSGATFSGCALLIAIVVPLWCIFPVAVVGSLRGLTVIGSLRGLTVIVPVGRLSVVGPVVGFTGRPVFLLVWPPLITIIAFRCSVSLIVRAKKLSFGARFFVVCCHCRCFVGDYS
jgi:hypothetical protein